MDIFDLATWISGVLKNHLSVPAVLMTIVLGSTIWLLSGRALRGWLLARWVMVPMLLLLASTAVAGPGRLFSKGRYEGKSLILFTPKNALTTLDLIGIACFSVAIGLGVALLWQVRKSP